MLDHALAYAADGWPVFPCCPETKRPLVGNDRDGHGQSIRGTGGLKKATVDEAQIRQWWSRWPKAMIGITTGSREQNGSGVFVVDLDVPKDTRDADGDAQQLYGFLDSLVDGLPETRTCVTASGGLHLYFMCPSTCASASPQRALGAVEHVIKNRAALLKSLNIPGHDRVPGDVDVRGDGGYVIVPPSARADGAIYDWLDCSLPIATAPQRLIDFVLRRSNDNAGAGDRPLARQAPVSSVSRHPVSEPQKGPARGVLPQNSPAHKPNDSFNGGSTCAALPPRALAAVRKYAESAMHHELDALGAQGEGGRNHALNRAAFSLGTLIGAGALDEGAVVSALRAACERNGLAKDDGWDQCEATIESGIEGGKRSPRDLSGVTMKPAGGGERPPPVSDIPDYVSGGDGSGIAVRALMSIDRRERSGGERENSVGDVPSGDGTEWVPGSAAPPRNDENLGGETAIENDDGPDIRLPERHDPRHGFSVEKMNHDWALVLMGAKAAVVHEQPDGPIEDRLRVLSVEAFNAWFANKFVERIQPDGKTKPVTWAKAWMTSGERRQYMGMVFHPDPGFAVGNAPDPAQKHPLATIGFRSHLPLIAYEPERDPDYLNLWRGFDTTPKDAGTYGTFKDHMINNVCGGDLDKFKWVFGSFAHMFQRPGERLGTAMVFRGKMGSGKSTIGEVMGSLIPAHYFQVDDPRYITGQFNAHMASCLLLQAEEAVWAGDKAAEGRLKGLITSKFQMIEAKGIDPIRVDNYVRLIMTSNEDWVVPAGKDERRFAVFDVSDERAQDHTYFRALWDELADGGREALLHDLLTFDLDQVDLRVIPKTRALLEQKIRSLDSVESWWFERLWTGEITRKQEGWKCEVEKRVIFADYLDQADEVGVRRKTEEVVFGTKLKKLLPAVQSRRGTVHDYEGGTRRPWMYILPDLDDCRAAFAASVGQEIDWPSESGEPVQPVAA